MDFFIVSLSNGFKNLAFITSTLIPFSLYSSAILIAVATFFPIATILISFPSFKISDFPYSNFSCFSNFIF